MAIATTGTSEQCPHCYTRWIGFCTWTWIGDRGPYCELCMSRGVTVYAVEELSSGVSGSGFESRAAI